MCTQIKSHLQPLPLSIKGIVRSIRYRSSCVFRYVSVRFIARSSGGFCSSSIIKIWICIYFHICWQTKHFKNIVYWQLHTISFYTSLYAWKRLKKHVCILFPKCPWKIFFTGNKNVFFSKQEVLYIERDKFCKLLFEKNNTKRKFLECDCHLTLQKQPE